MKLSWKRLKLGGTVRPLFRSAGCLRKLRPTQAGTWLSLCNSQPCGGTVPLQQEEAGQPEDAREGFAQACGVHQPPRPPGPPGSPAFSVETTVDPPKREPKPMMLV